MNSHNSGSILTTPDILVIGGGSAGVAAATGAAKHGATVALVEKNAFGGGKATVAYVGTICGLYYRSEDPIARFAHQGFPMEFALELAERSKSKPVQFKEGLHFLPYEYFDFMRLCDEQLKKSTRSLCFHSQVQSAHAENNCVTSLTAMISNKQVVFRPKAVVDASGENLLADLLNINSIKSDHYQAAAQVFQISGIKETDVALLSMALIRSVQKGIHAKLLQPHFERVSIVPGSLRNDSVLLKLPLPLQISNDLQNRSELELFSRSAIQELMSFLKVNCEAFKYGSIAFVAPEAGVRTGPRHEGKYILTGDDVLKGRKQTNAIARGAWPVEYWEPGKNVKMEYFEMNDFYDIPAEAIESNAITNLFFGGRNISADDKAIASARVIGTCLATGYAAGVLAAFHALNKSRADAVVAIQNDLFISSAGI